MIYHKNEKYQIPQLIQSLKYHGLETDKPSQLADSFRQGWVAGAALPERDALAKQLCVESGELDINQTVYRDQGNRWTAYSGEPAWHPFLIDADRVITAIQKLKGLK